MMINMRTIVEKMLMIMRAMLVILMRIMQTINVIRMVMRTLLYHKEHGGHKAGQCKAGTGMRN